MQFKAWSINSVFFFSFFLWDCRVCAKLIKELEAIVGIMPASGKRKSGLLVSLRRHIPEDEDGFSYTSPDLREEVDLPFSERWRAYITISPWADIV